MFVYSESGEGIANLLSKMCLQSKLKSKGKEVVVTIPPTRHDVIHHCDIYEDVAIAYGYNKIERTLPNTSTIAQQYPINKLTDLLRGPIAEAGFTEALTFSLVILFFYFEAELFTGIFLSVPGMIYRLSLVI